MHTHSVNIRNNTFKGNICFVKNLEASEISEALFGFIAKSGETLLGMTLCYTAYSTWQGEVVKDEFIYLADGY